MQGTLSKLHERVRLFILICDIGCDFTDFICQEGEANNMRYALR